MDTAVQGHANIRSAAALAATAAAWFLIAHPRGLIEHPREQVSNAHELAGGRHRNGPEFWTCVTELNFGEAPISCEIIVRLMH